MNGFRYSDSTSAYFTAPSPIRRGLTAVAISCVIVAIASPAFAQYFGRNKVRYRPFNFQVMKTEHFDIYFYPNEREGVEIAARLAERWYSRLSRLLNHTLSDRQPLVLYASHADFEQTNIATEEISEGVGGFTEPMRRRIVLPLAGPIADTDHVIGHELVHAFQFDMSGPLVSDVEQSPMEHLPLWFIEGMAEYLSLGRVDANVAMKLRDALQRNQLPAIADLQKPKYFPYQWGHAVFAYVAGQYGEHAVARLFRSAALSGDVRDAIEGTLHISIEGLSNNWHAAIRQQYGPVIAAATPLPDHDRLEIRAQLASMLNIAPALSPDGRQIAFLSSRDLFSTDLYIADAYTGRIRRRLTRTATDPHFSSIEFINSAATWDKSGTHVAIGTITGGRAAIAIFDIRTGKRTREIPLAGIDEIVHPSWAPDGHAIALTGMHGGLTDLYVYDLTRSTLTPITSDPYADLYPAWSPDSQRLAFATDRFSSDLPALRMGGLRLAILDVQDGTPRPVPAFATGKQINPQWSPDGGSLHFIADPDGVSNVYRVSLTTGKIEALSSLGVGISGITASSPALSVAGNRLAVSTYQDERYSVSAWSGGEPIDPPPALGQNLAALPPADRPPGLPNWATAASTTDSTPAEPYPTIPYKPKMSLVSVGQPTASAGVGSYGPIVGGSGSFAFQDVLNDRMLLTAVQAGNSLTNSFSFSDVAFAAGYARSDHRWQWRLVGGQVPYVAGTFESGPGTAPSGDGVEIVRQTIYREVERSAGAVVMYPLDRSRRLEFQGTAAQSSFEQIVNATAFSVTTGQLLSDTGQTFSIARPMNLATAATAFVSDTASVGPTSPIQGQRYRLEVSPTFGSVNFTSILADYRRYLMPAPFYTIAARVIQYSRVGSGAEDLRLHPLYLNDPGLVRGYVPLTAVRCVSATDDFCAMENRFSGSRVAVANLEVRFPLLRWFGVSQHMYGPMPVEVAFFGDAGVAWNHGEKPAILGGTRRGISSTGAAFRVGLGVAVLELDAVRPTARPDAGWTFGINLIPGW